MRAGRAAAGDDPFAVLTAIGMAYIECGIRTPGLFGLLLRPDLCPQLGSEGFEDGSKAAHDELVRAVARCAGKEDDGLVELAWSMAHGFVELQLLGGVTGWEEKAAAMIGRTRSVFLVT